MNILFDKFKEKSTTSKRKNNSHKITSILSIRKNSKSNNIKFESKLNQHMKAKDFYKNYQVTKEESLSKDFRKIKKTLII